MLPALLLLLLPIPAPAQTAPGPGGVPAGSPDGEAPVVRWSGTGTIAPAGPATPVPGNVAATGGGAAADFLFTGSLPEGDLPTAAAFTPDGTRLVVAHRDSRNLVIFDAATRLFLQEVPLSGSPADMAVSSDGIHAVTANIWEDTASIVDLSTAAEIAVVAVGSQPGVVRFTPGGLTAVVGNTVSQSLSVIDVTTATEIRRIPGTGFTATTAFSFEPGSVNTVFTAFEMVDDSTVIHPDFIHGTIDFFDLTTGIEASLPSATQPIGIAITPDRSRAVVSHFLGSRTLSVVDTAAQAVTAAIPTGIDLWQHVAIKPDGTQALAAVQNAVVLVDLVTHSVSAPINTASVNRLLATPDGNYVLGVGYRGSLVSWAAGSVVKELNNLTSAWVGAVSPIGTRAVMISNQLGEDMVVANTNGAAGFVEGFLPSGPPPEADRTRKVAVSPDGALAVTTNILSDNVSILDLATGSVLAIVPVGDRPAEPEITPDGSLAVVANLDSAFVSVIDLTSFSVTNIPISTRGSEVEIAPDGSYAYVAVVVNDGVWRIDLNTLAVSGPRLPAANMGSLLYNFNQASGMTLSHDGTTLAVCGSFGNAVTLIDTASWTVAATVGVGAMPARALFSADDSTLYVSNRDGGTVSVIDNSGAGSSLSGTIAVGTWPFEMGLAPGGGTLYVANYQDHTVGVVDLASGLQTAAVALPSAPQGLFVDSSGSVHVSSGGFTVTLGPGPAVSISLFGEYSIIDPVSLSVTQQIDTGLPPAELEPAADGSFALVPSPMGDGLTRLALPVSGLTLSQTPLVRGQPAAFTVTGVLPGESVHFGYSLAGTGAGPCPPKLGGLCLDLLPPIVLFRTAVAGPGGTAVANVTVPPGAPLRDVHTQAVVRRGPGGADSRKSNPVSTTIQP